MNKKGDSIFWIVILVLEIGLFIFGIAMFTISPGNNSGVIYTDKSNGECSIQCHDLMYSLNCQSTASQETNYCKCVMFDCHKKIPYTSKPLDYSEYILESKVLTSQLCFKNGQKVKCSEID